MEASENPVLKWAINVISQAPPMQNLVAFLIVLLLAAPLIKAGWREFRSAKKTEPPKPVEAVPIVQVDQAWLYTTLINTDLKIGEVNKKLDTIGTQLAGISNQMTMMDKILRRRATKARKNST